MLKKRLQIGYIRYDDRTFVNLIEKIFIVIRKFLAIVYLEKIDNGVLLLIPKYKYYNSFLKKRILNQIKKYIFENKLINIVVENELDNNLTKEIRMVVDNIHLLNGKYLMKNLVWELFEYIFNIIGINSNLENVYIFVNEYTPNNIAIIQMMADRFKTVNIITEKLMCFKKLEESLYEDGILITVSNNKRKSAKNAKFIVNIDFEKDVFEQYIINMDSVIINLTNENIFFEKVFRGILINDISISFNNDLITFVNEFYGKVNFSQFFESWFLENNIDVIRKVFIENGGYIINVLGVRGIISIEEFSSLKIGTNPLQSEAWKNIKIRKTFSDFTNTLW